MEMNEILMLVGLILVGYFLLKFLWNMVGNLIKLTIVVILVGVGVHFIRPDLIDNLIGKEMHDSITTQVNEGADKVDDIMKEKGDSLGNKAKDSVTLSN